MTYRVFIKRLLFITMTFMILLCTSGCGEDEEGVYKNETKALLKLSDEIKTLGEASFSSDKEGRDLLIKLHKAYYKGKSGYEKALEDGYKLFEKVFIKGDKYRDSKGLPTPESQKALKPILAAKQQMKGAKGELMLSIEAAYKKHFLDYNNFVAYTEMIIKQQKDESKINKAFETHPYAYAIPQKDIVRKEIQSKNTNEAQDKSVNYKDRETDKQNNSIVLSEKEVVSGKQKQPVQANNNLTSSDKVLNKAVGTITGNDVNVRTGPGVSFKSLGVFYKGDVVRIVETARNSNNEIWHRVEFDNPKVGLVVGWVRTDFILIR